MHGQPAQTPTVIVIGGVPGAGKSTAARRLAADLSLPFLTSDTVGQTVQASGHTEVTGLVGKPTLQGALVRDNEHETTTSSVSTGGLFVLIGAPPETAWLDGELAEDRDWFLVTGADIPVSLLERRCLWKRVGGVSCA